MEAPLTTINTFKAPKLVHFLKNETIIRKNIKIIV